MYLYPEDPRMSMLKARFYKSEQSQLRNLLKIHESNAATGFGRNEAKIECSKPPLSIQRVNLSSHQNSPSGLTRDHQLSSRPSVQLHSSRRAFF